MPIFLDGHKLGDIKANELHVLQDEPEDEFGVIHVNIHYNEDEDKCYCLISAPNKEAVEKHHAKVDIICDFIVEVNSTAN